MSATPTAKPERPVYQGVSAPLPRIGIVGAGSLSTKRIYPNIGKAGAVLAAVCDLDEQRARANAERFGGRAVYTDMDRMLAEAELDGVIICVGPAFHPVGAEKVMRAGLPVYTEKPPAATAADARRVLEVSRQTGQLCMTAFKKRYANCYRRAKQFIASEAFGEPHLLSIDYGSGGYGPSGEGFLLDFSIHAIDLARFLFGEVRSVYAAARRQQSYAVSLSFAGGAVGTLSLSNQRAWKAFEEVEITGTGGAWMTVHNSNIYRVFEKGEIVDYYEPPFYISGGEGEAETGHLGEIIAFLEAIREGSRPPSEIESSYRTMLLYEAIRDSAAKRAPVEVDYGVR